jgi:AraC-like DNA-binding protein
MKKIDPICFKVPRLEEETVRVEVWDLPHFYDSIHFHEECQITLILKGEGALSLGDHLTDFKEGDLLVIGKNTPHVLLNPEEYYREDSHRKVRAISVFFSDDTFRHIFKRIPETARIEEFLEMTRFGVRIRCNGSESLEREMNNLADLKLVPRIILFIELLDLISSHSRIEVLSSALPAVNCKEDTHKLQKIFDYIARNFDKKITLEEVAGMVNLTPTAFCRFFKLRTNKTFSQFLIEVRIKQACKLLSDGNFNVTETFFSCGYNNSSNFHRHFRQHTGLTPSEYRERLVLYRPALHTA